MLREYFINTVGVALAISLALSITHPRLKKATAFSFGVLTICAVLLPLVDLLGGFDIDKTLNGIFDGFNYEASDSAIELAFEDAIREKIADDYGVSKECILVRADGFDIGSLSAERIFVTLSGEAVFLDYKRIEEEVSSDFTRGGECEVSVNIG